jgi:SNF2 family DNA or RNA helicase
VALRDALLPFQREGVRIGLQRDGRMLLADEVGVGKTLQALALAAAYAHEGPILIIVPASLRFMWAEQVEKWLRVPPHACTVVLGVGNMPELDDLPRRGDPQPAAAASPRVVITSYHMLQQVDHNVDWARFAWGCVVVDESHNMRAANRDESAATQIAVRVVKAALHAILMSGTPAMDRPYDLYCQVDALHPGLLNSKDVFANGYCERRPSRFKRGAFTCSGGARLQELHLLLRSTVMLRREKKEVAAELPPMRRQVVRLDVADSHSVAGFADMEKAHMVGWRKVEAACEWLADALLRKGNTPKSVIFVYHMDIMVRLKAFLETHIGSSKDGMVVLETPYVTINGDDDSRARQDAVVRFRSPHVRVALLSIAAASTGLDFSSAEAVVFVELPQSASDLEQAEARVHRRGVCGAPPAQARLQQQRLTHALVQETSTSITSSDAARATSRIGPRWMPRFSDATRCMVRSTRAGCAWTRWWMLRLALCSCCLRTQLRLPPPRRCRRSQAPRLPRRRATSSMCLPTRCASR